MNQATTPAETPLMQQYQALKSAYPHAILFFRLGDFYEMFDDDAKTASAICGLVLTARHGTPMCGIPYHSSSNYISRLLAAGRKIAICEQTAQPVAENGKKAKLFKREVVRLITPGTIVEDELLQTKALNYLAAVEIDLVGWALAYIDISTGEFFATQNLKDADFYQLAALLSKISPSEIIASGRVLETLRSKALTPEGTVLSEGLAEPERPAWTETAIWSNNRLAVKAALQAAAYVKANQPGLKESFIPAFFEPAHRMQLDDSAIKTLELVSSEHGEDAKTLWGVLDFAKTSMGSRMLKKWILEPLTDLHGINARQQFTAFLARCARSREDLAGILVKVPDIERILGRVINQSASPRDASAVRAALSQASALKTLIGSAEFFACVPELSTRMNAGAGALAPLLEALNRALSDTPPARLADGGTIKDGYSPELDELRALRKNSQGVLAELETREREKTGISSLKAGYNSVFGYYLEVTKTHQAKVPPHFIRKQTLANAERFITEELKLLESKILGAEERILKLELHLFGEIRSMLLFNLGELRNFALTVAELDVYIALAESAVKYNFVRPVISNDSGLILEEGRHPVAERYLPAGSFVPNDLALTATDPQIIILTGPNMSGKSVYLRQSALIVIMAQIGSFVPAKSAVIGIVDRVMTRIGAQDRLARGESTFMVEMRETAAILHLATPKSLILLDEVGRGTSTFDGISIAWAVVEYLYRAGGGPKVLFATHYFELTGLAEKFAGIKNFNVAVKEWTNSAGKTEVVFLHKILPGHADQSYGIHVAQLAGLPDAAIIRAREILRTLESNEKLGAGSEKAELSAPLLPIFSDHPVLSEIKFCDPDAMTPLQALQVLTAWKKRLN